MFYLGTLYLISNIIGSFVSGWIVASIGRKWALFCFGIPLALSWLLMGLSTNHYMLYVSCFSQGLLTAVPWTAVGEWNTIK